MVTGQASRFRQQRRMYGTFTYIRDKLNAEDMGEVREKFDLLLKEKDKLIKKNEKLENKCKSILSQLGKKIGTIRVIRSRADYAFTSKQGALYFDKRHIGKWVIVLEKK